MRHAVRRPGTIRRGNGHQSERQNDDVNKLFHVSLLWVFYRLLWT
jgi:hypothetical protein